LIEFDAMMEQAQQRRLARLRDNRSASSIGAGIEEVIFLLSAEFLLAN